MTLRALMFAILLFPLLAFTQERGAFLSVPTPGLRVVVDTLPPVFSPVDSLPVPARRACRSRSSTTPTTTR